MTKRMPCQHRWIWSLGRFVCAKCYERMAYAPKWSKGAS
jgi:hypothetical protein